MTCGFARYRDSARRGLMRRRCRSSAARRPGGRRSGTSTAASVTADRSISPRSASAPQRRDGDRLGVDVEVAADRGAGVGEAEPVRAERDERARAPTAGSGRGAPASSPRPRRRARRVSGEPSARVTYGTRGSSPGCTRLCCSASTPSRRSSPQLVTDHTSAPTPHSLGEHVARCQRPRQRDAGGEQPDLGAFGARRRRGSGRCRAAGRRRRGPPARRAGRTARCRPSGST